MAKKGILEGWSPQQVAERLRREQSLQISHEIIYQRICVDKAAGGQLYKKLRCQKKRRKRYGFGRNLRGHIPARVGIEKRPYLVEFRLRAGDWEGDTIIGANQQQAIVSLGGLDPISWTVLLSGQGFPQRADFIIHGREIAKRRMQPLCIVEA